MLDPIFSFHANLHLWCSSPLDLNVSVMVDWVLKLSYLSFSLLTLILVSWLSGCSKLSYVLYWFPFWPWYSCHGWVGVKNWLSSCQFHIWPWYKSHGGVGVTIQLSVSSPFDLDMSVMVEWLLKSVIYQFPCWPWYNFISIMVEWVLKISCLSFSLTYHSWLHILVQIHHNPVWATFWETQGILISWSVM